MIIENSFTFYGPVSFLEFVVFFEPTPLAAAVKTSNHLQCRVPISRGAPEAFFLDEFINNSAAQGGGGSFRIGNL